MQSSSEVLNKFGENLVNDIKFAIRNKNLTGNGPSVASGDLVNSVRYEVKENELSIYALQYIGALQYGRKPTVNPIAGNPTLKERIRVWLDQKGIEPDGISKDSLAFLIARKIHREGTSIYQRTQGQSSGLLDDVLNDQLIERIQSELVFSFIVEIRSEILKNIPSNMISQTA